MTKAEMKRKGDILRAVADYIRDADVAAYFDDDSIVEESEQRLAELLGVPKYNDGSGYNWKLFMSPSPK